MTRRRIALLVVPLLLLAACGSSSTSSTATAAAGTTGDSDAVQAARVRAAGCVRSQGINIPDPTPGTGSIRAIYRILGTYPNAKVQAALRACASSIRQAFPAAAILTPAQRARGRQAIFVFSQCMRAHGINYPDPTTAASDPSAYYGALGSLPVGTPAYRAAATPCRATALKTVGG